MSEWTDVRVSEMNIRKECFSRNHHQESGSGWHVLLLSKLQSICWVYENMRSISIHFSCTYFKHINQ